MMYQGGSLKVLKLECSFQNNAWGKLGSESMVVRLVKSADDSFNIDENEHYAELCITYSGMRKIKWKKEESDYALSFLYSLCRLKFIHFRFGGDMSRPFMACFSRNPTLFKSIFKKKTYKQTMHEVYPRQIKTDIWTKSLPRIIQIETLIMKTYKFVKIICANFKTGDNSVKSVFVKLLCNLCNFSDNMGQNKNHLKKIKTKIYFAIQFILQLSGQNVQYYIPDIINKINTEYPGDVGIFAIYFLNIVDLQPGEAIFIDANIPHAYIYGDCLECMACSHNVIRAGLTFKYRDVNTFCNTVNYTGRSAEDMKLQSNQIQLEIGISETKFQPHVPDFAVSVIKILSGNKTVHLTAIDSASICLVYTGEGQASSSSLTEPIKLKTGIVFFIAACHTVSVDVQSNDMTIFRACYNTSETFSKVASAF
ncbi:mannose-6-phosphate isomerase [Mytilus galloprovincialis]|uniref:Phosphohexomutase n=1 Tax=Mytilus galloprovincialis TaxID=29158 RepID=A0A8B6GZ34_MYTGA|nr:mannose-6-phosphate isomerase [Mytilus galloprovincialis]